MTVILETIWEQSGDQETSNSITATTIEREKELRYIPIVCNIQDSVTNTN
jgi:hypothetical protein